jgi:hypothetical protein
MYDEPGLFGQSDAELARVDPLEMNLVVAKGIPALAKLDILHYKWRRDKWANAIKRKLPGWDNEFWKTPQDWDNNIHELRTGMVCHFVHHDLGVRYKEQQRDVASISYTEPGDLFLNGVMDTRRGTCGNMAALHVALGWRLGWPVSLALAGWHCIPRFDDGKMRFNIEATNTESGFRTNPDSFYQAQHRVAKEDIDSGSDLTTLKPRQLLGLFIGLRGRHWWDTAKYQEANQDFQKALLLYPQSRIFRRMMHQCGYTYPQDVHITSAWR